MVVSKGVVEREVPVDLWLDTVQCRQGCLRVEVDSKHAVSGQSQMLRQVDCSRCLAAASFEINDGDDLQPFAIAAAGTTVEIIAEFVHLLGGIRPPARWRRRRLDALAFQMSFLRYD